MLLPQVVRLGWSSIRWVLQQREFGNLSKDTSESDKDINKLFTVVGIGDMSGDVFGMMLYLIK